MDGNLTQLLMSMLVGVVLFLYIKDKKKYMKDKEYIATDQVRIFQAYLGMALCILSAIISVFRLLA
ncbi:hypothetical protein [Riemerella columbina]|uniref:hypothetical protein n=1 Tax=Riemerella columbina TaxID=103810 RepID=UPI00036F3C0C|nr:hypothetical protein [Riemerella columbina]